MHEKNSGELFLPLGRHRVGPFSYWLSGHPVPIRHSFTAICLTMMHGTVATGKFHGEIDMSLTNASEQALLDLLFLNTDWANIGDAGGLQNSAAAGSFYVSLHSGDPGEAGDQTTSEVAYTSYARVAVARTSGGWTRASSTMSNTALVQFPQCTGSTATATHFGVGTALTGAGNLILKGALTSSLSISNGIQPQFAASALTASVD